MLDNQPESTAANRRREHAVTVAAKAPRTPADADHKSAIVTIRRKRSVGFVPPGLLPDTPEEHRRRGDAAAALFREVVRRASGKDQR